jgi:hypothetical protein
MHEDVSIESAAAIIKLIATLLKRCTHIHGPMLLSPCLLSCIHTLTLALTHAFTCTCLTLHTLTRSVAAACATPSPPISCACSSTF